jgi:hypothetical protein
VSKYTNRSKYISLVRHRGADDPEAKRVRQELRADALERQIREVVDSAPPLTPEQRDRLSLLLHGGDAA